jgi:hypothetical protein
LTRKEPWRLLQGTALAGADANLSRPMRAFLGKLVAPEPRQRFGSAAEARAALDRLGTRRRWRAARAATRTAARAGAWSLPRQVAASALALAALAVPGVVALALFSDGHDSSERSPHRSHEESLRVANEARRAALVAQLSAYNTLACSCSDRRCIDDVSARITRWSKEMSAAGEAAPLDSDTLREIGALSRSMSACITRVLSTSMPNFLRQDEGAEVEVGAPARGGADPDPRPAKQE